MSFPGPTAGKSTASCNLGCQWLVTPPRQPTRRLATGKAAWAKRLRRYAADVGLVVLMANQAAPSGGYRVAGRSALWAAGTGSQRV